MSPIDRLRAMSATFPDDPFACEPADIRALFAAHDRLQMLLTIALIAVDMPPAKSDEPWVRLVEAAHAHGRKLQREEDDQTVAAVRTDNENLRKRLDMVEAALVRVREESADLYFRLAEPGDTSINDIAAAIRRGDR